jgi:hypothetical protein
MNLEKYDQIKVYDNYVYEFYSEGPKGRIRKIVKFQPVEGESSNLFNLYFGDFIESTGKVNDLSVSNNNDRNKVLFTVAAIVHDFMKFRPAAIILAVGSTDVRTRLYQMSICAFWKEISSEYIVYGNSNDEWVCFEKNVNYEGFLVFKKD